MHRPQVPLSYCPLRPHKRVFHLMSNDLCHAHTIRMSSTTRRYACSAPGCTKSFVRPEHLYRHRLNRMYRLPSQSIPSLGIGQINQNNLMLVRTVQRLSSAWTY
jgi:hypothetical protein